MADEEGSLTVWSERRIPQYNRAHFLFTACLVCSVSRDPTFFMESNEDQDCEERFRRQWRQRGRDIRRELKNGIQAGTVYYTRGCQLGVRMGRPGVEARKWLSLPVCRDW